MALISVIIPALNEASQIGASLDQFISQAGEWECLVVDGGSSDDTVERAASKGARVLRAEGGRGPQMNAGAAAARGDLLLFLHADARLPEDAAALMAKTLEDPRVVAGCFRIRHTASRWEGSWRAGLLRVADLRSRYTRLPYGDQGLFLRRATFEALGGFPGLPLMEDLAFSRILAARGRIATVAKPMQVSARRFESGFLRAVLCMNSFPLLARLGVSAHRLQRWYGHGR